MLDAKIKESLTEHFKGLKSEIELVITHENHEKSSELKDFLNEVASCSPRVTVSLKDHEEKPWGFSIERESVSTGIFFQGIPSGHEFTSFVLAITNNRKQ